MKTVIVTTLILLATIASADCRTVTMTDSNGDTKTYYICD